MKWILYGAVFLAGMIAIVLIVGTLLPKSHVATRSARFKQPREAVFTVIAGAPDWRPDVARFELLPARDGHPQWREFDKHGQAILFERTSYDPPARMETRIADPKLPFGGRWLYEIEQTGTETRVRITEHGEVYNPVFRFVSKFVMGHTATLDKYLRALGAKFGENIRLED